MAKLSSRVLDRSTIPDFSVNEPLLREKNVLDKLRLRYSFPAVKYPILVNEVLTDFLAIVLFLDVTLRNYSSVSYVK